MTLIEQNFPTLDMMRYLEDELKFKFDRLKVSTIIDEYFMRAKEKGKEEENNKFVLHSYLCGSCCNIIEIPAFNKHCSLCGSNEKSQDILYIKKSEINKEETGK